LEVAIITKDLVQLMETAWRDGSFKQAFLNNPKMVIAQEMDEVIPDFIHLKTLQETPDMIWLIIPPKPDNWPDITETPADEHLKPNELKNKQERAAAVQAAVQAGHLDPAQIIRAIVQFHLVASAWADDAVMQELLSSPKAIFEKVAAEKGLPLAALPADFQIKALEETGTRRYMLLPADPDQPELSGLERAVKTEFARGSSHKWRIANVNAWGYSAPKHGITLPYCGAFVGITVETKAGQSPAVAVVSSLPAGQGSGRLAVEMPL
jgi:hypothetical protein